MQEQTPFTARENDVTGKERDHSLYQLGPMRIETYIAIEVCGEYSLRW